MKIYALSDLHLSFSNDKAMDKFGEKWHEHWRKVATNWEATVKAEDIVLIAGDISWAMRPPEAEQDLLWLSSLKGHKVLIRGNHDYWWQGIGKLRQSYPELCFVQNDSVSIGEVSICGSRGWPLPDSPEYDPHDEKIFQRELARMELSLKSLDLKAKLRIAMMHYPPQLKAFRPSEFSQLFEYYKVNACVFGHLHNYTRPGLSYSSNGINYYLTSADYLDFQPTLIWDGELLADPNKF
ncbi:MAG: metallophosphoesterase [bacterium]|nr:metallophosphoesterase [bacterium]